MAHCHKRNCERSAAIHAFVSVFLEFHNEKAPKNRGYFIMA
jgi:hypothetical protein